MLRVVVFYFVLLIGSFFGVPMCPKDIEEALHARKQMVAEESSNEDDSERKAGRRPTVPD